MQVKILNNGGFIADSEPESYPFTIKGSKSAIDKDNENILIIPSDELSEHGLIISGRRNWNFLIGDECEIIEE